MTQVLVDLDELERLKSIYGFEIHTTPALWDRGRGAQRNKTGAYIESISPSLVPLFEQRDKENLPLWHVASILTDLKVPTRKGAERWSASTVWHLYRLWQRNRKNEKWWINS